MSSKLGKQVAFTLIEIIVTIVIVSIAATALLSVFSSLIRTSADPMIQQQAVTIAEAYMEEIMLQSFDDPTDTELGAAAVEAGETSRALFDDVQDYNHLGTTQVRNQNNGVVAALADYSITVSVTATALNSTNPVPAAASMRIDITVSHPAIGDIGLSAFRTDF
jgi:MSHA pilin protein MshD